MVESRRHIPVDEPHIVAGVILAYFPKSHSATLEGAVIFPRKEVARQALALYFQFADFF